MAKELSSINAYHKSWLFISSLVAAILYNIWFLGLFLDPNLLNNSYVSALEVSGKTFAWLFILADVIAGLLILLIGLYLYKKHSEDRIIIYTYSFFGFLTLVDGIIPIDSKCETSISSCGIALSQVISLHDILSIMASVAVFISLRNVKKKLHSADSSARLYKRASKILTFWILCCIFLVISVVIDNFTIYSQGLFILATSFMMMFVPYVLVDDKND